MDGLFNLLYDQLQAIATNKSSMFQNYIQKGGQQTGLIFTEIGTFSGRLEQAKTPQEKKTLLIEFSKQRLKNWLSRLSQDQVQEESFFFRDGYE